MAEQRQRDAVVEVGGGELLDVYLGLLEGSTGGTNFQLLDGTILTALETLVDSPMSRPRNHRVDYFGVLGDYNWD